MKGIAEGQWSREAGEGGRSTGAGDGEGGREEEEEVEAVIRGVLTRRDCVKNRAGGRQVKEIGKKRQKTD